MTWLNPACKLCSIRLFAFRELGQCDHPSTACRLVRNKSNHSSMIVLVLCSLFTFIDIASSVTYHLRVDGCDHNGATCESANSNFTLLCISNSLGSGLSPDECACCDDIVPNHPCNTDFGTNNSRRLLSSNYAKYVHNIHHIILAHK